MNLHNLFHDAKEPQPEIKKVVEFIDQKKLADPEVGSRDQKDNEPVDYGDDDSSTVQSLRKRNSEVGYDYAGKSGKTRTYIDKLKSKYRGNSDNDLELLFTRVADIDSTLNAEKSSVEQLKRKNELLDTTVDELEQANAIRAKEVDELENQNKIYDKDVERLVTQAKQTNKLIHALVDKEKRFSDYVKKTRQEKDSLRSELDHQVQLGNKADFELRQHIDNISKNNGNNQSRVGPITNHRDQQRTVAESKIYFSIASTDTQTLRESYGMKRDGNGWYLDKETATLRQLLEARRTFTRK